MKIDKPIMIFVMNAKPIWTLILLIFSTTKAQELGSKMKVCDYDDPIAAVKVEDSGIPCSSLYVGSLDTQGFGKNVSLETIAEFNVLTTTHGFRCHKLELVAHCIQHWFTGNERKLSYLNITFGRDECLTGAGCVNCEVSGQYPPYECKTGVWGEVFSRRTILFRYNDIVYTNKIGESFYGKASTTGNHFYIPGNYETYFHFPQPSVNLDIKQEVFYPNADWSVLVSPTMKKILTYEGATKNINGKTWRVYGDSLIYIEPGAVSPNNNTITVGGNPNQAYYEFFTRAQLSILNFRLEYMECRLKNTMILQQQQSKSIDQKTFLDLGAGEVYEKGFIRRFNCYLAPAGTLSADGNCIGYRVGTQLYRVTRDGELRNSTTICTTTIRVNRTHILMLEDGNVIETEYAYPTLQDEEAILNHIPNVVVDLENINKLIISSKIFETGSSSNLNESVVSGGSGPDLTSFIDSILNSSVWKWFSFISSSILILAICVGGTILLVWAIRLCKEISPTKKEKQTDEHSEQIHTSTLIHP